MGYYIDVKNFWEENQKCFKPFSTDKPRIPLVLMFEDHYIINELPLDDTERYYHDLFYRVECNKRMNNKIENVIGLRPYSEKNISYLKYEFEVLWGAERIIKQGNTPWIKSKIQSINDVKDLIKKMEETEMKNITISEDKKILKNKLKKTSDINLKFKHSCTGPATIACNLLGTENVCMFIMDYPSIMKNFFETMLVNYIDYLKITEYEDKGFIEKNGIGINDDCCYLFTPDKYKRLCVPFLEKIFEEFAPQSNHKRRHHSDSPMGHLMPFLRELGVNEVNLGPELFCKLAN